ncbi:MAG TPA: hypothetical protein PLE54_03570 [Burkholderiaceae bacterium]|nr:hypothetical protein [Burkholderiaceae bacterium]
MGASPVCAQHGIASPQTRTEAGPAMQQVTFESSSQPTARRSHQRSAYVVGGTLLAVAVITAAIIELPGGRALQSGAVLESSAPVHASVNTDNAAATAGSTSAGQPGTPHFERSDEPAVEDTMNTYGG